MFKSWKFWALTWWYELGGWVWHRRLRRETGEVYMDRWQLLRTKPLSIYINRINLPDADPLLHTHPWKRSYSVKLRRQYVEQLPGSVFRVPPRFSRIPEEHRITAVPEGGVWTLFIGLGKTDDDAWGFVADDGYIIPNKVRKAQRGVENES